MKNLKIFLLLLAASLAFAACEKESSEEPVICPVESLEGLLVMNNGNLNGNDANICLYNLDTEALMTNVFQTVNGMQLGDVAQDIALVGQNIYIAVNNSQVIFVTDRLLQVKRQIVARDGERALSPRSLVAVGDKVYATYYEGFVGEISPADDYRVRITPVGNSPEGIAYADGRLYVANSGGALYPDFENTVSVVDVKEFRETERFVVNENPKTIVPNAEGTMLYVSSIGNYGDVPAKLQSVDIARNYAVSDLAYTEVKDIVAGDADNLYVVTGGYNENWQIAGTVNIYDMRARKEMGKLTDETISNYYSISYTGGLVVVGASDYVTNGDIFVYDTRGTLLKKFDSNGLNPQKALFLKK